MNNQLYEGYFVTSCGKVWSYKSKKFLKPMITKDGYKSVALYINGKRKIFRIHQLVAQTYIPNLNNYDTVDHIDDNKEHNYINNLQWMTRKNNVKKSQSKKTLCVETGEIFESATAAAERYSLSFGNLCAVCRGEYQTCGGYHWKYVE